jgi:CTP synthase
MERQYGQDRARETGWTATGSGSDVPEQHNAISLRNGRAVSSVGKGDAVAHGAALRSRGLTSRSQLDPYINVDPGTMSPFQHGEVFVTDDGFETDLDLGHYERLPTSRPRRRTSLLARSTTPSSVERRGGYLGGTIQVVPHITNDQAAHPHLAAQSNADAVICEVARRRHRASCSRPSARCAAMSGWPIRSSSM